MRTTEQLIEAVQTIEAPDLNYEELQLLKNIVPQLHYNEHR
jgi:hypothetical protein